jgi:hypothetical protein
MDEHDRLLKDLVEHFNRGVETGDFWPLLRLFAPDAILTFHDQPRGPYVGREGISNSYRSAPPDDEIEILDSHLLDGILVVGYSWMHDVTTRAGEMRFSIEDGLVKALEIIE